MENKELELKLAIEEVNLVLGALSKQPYEIVAKLINKITTEAQKQINDAE